MTTALVVGGAACVWKDTARALGLFTPDLIVVVKSVGVIWPWRIDLWASYPKHAAKMAAYVKRRTLAGLPAAGEIVMRDPSLPCGPVAGCSGFLGLAVALEHCDKAVLVGMPMDVTPHWDCSQPWQAALQYRPQWERGPVKRRIKDRARSMSGWTRELLGAPTEEWLQ